MHSDNVIRKKYDKTRRSLRVWAYSAIILLGCFATAVRGDVFPVGPDAFGPNAVVEGFEAIVGVELPPLSWMPIAAEVPIPWDFGSGVSLTGANPDEAAYVLDFALDPPGQPDYAWALSVDGGQVDWTTEIPSPTSILVHDTYMDSGDILPLKLTFDLPVMRVGFFAEAAIFHDIGWEGSITLEAFDLFGESLGLVEVFADGCGMNTFVEPPVDLGPLDTWIGLEALEPIGSVEIVGEFFVMDDLIFETQVVSIENQTWGAVKSMYR